mmetsp:Transcript_4417/g.5951  ORF Transcript_4417/g.5951 Transcript_4417/m.5951 type:complete len:219 (-) Transcript_4417:128-784(-)|eukprot:CAMPEP_0196585784 /NCGR_PEP_ID=MMETSP1081-20130531/51985_1 /TAXON_ID=36882 /ORGANISM="Pyramimonas amylifera, Strain CCMP720" /LENGTH=218 /DNA_ID=CAMNT_0041907449 /DNA_START=416 /DNA_END=1072 /DNA_ORIENTATION=-
MVPIVLIGEETTGQNASLIEYNVSSGLHFNEQGFEVYDFETDSYFEVPFNNINKCVASRDAITLDMKDSAQKVRLVMVSSESVQLYAETIQLAVSAEADIGNPAAYIQCRLSLPQQATKQLDLFCFPLTPLITARRQTEDGHSFASPKESEVSSTTCHRQRSCPFMTRLEESISADKEPEPIIQFSEFLLIPDYKQQTDIGYLSAKVNCDAESDFDIE